MNKNQEYIKLTLAGNTSAAITGSDHFRGFTIGVTSAKAGATFTLGLNVATNKIGYLSTTITADASGNGAVTLELGANFKYGLSITSASNVGETAVVHVCMYNNVLYTNRLGSAR